MQRLCLGFRGDPLGRGSHPTAREALRQSPRDRHREGEIWPRCSFALDLDDVVLGLFQTDPFKPCGWEFPVEASPDRHRDVFGGRQTTLEPVHVAVQMAMVDVVDHEVLHNPVDLPQIDHHARVDVHRSADSHLELVVVAVIAGTCPEYLAIAGLVPLWFGKDMTGRKGQSSSHADSVLLLHAYMR